MSATRIKYQEATQVRPLYDHVLVEPQVITETFSGLQLPDAAGNHPVRGRVIAIGTGIADAHGNIRRPDVEIGNIVFFAKYGGSQLKLDGRDFLILKDTDILGVLVE